MASPLLLVEVLLHTMKLNAIPLAGLFDAQIAPVAPKVECPMEKYYAFPLQ
jgi:hypothetical protein